MNRRKRKSGSDSQDWEDLSYGGIAEEEEPRPSRRRRRPGRNETAQEESWVSTDNWSEQREEPPVDDYRPSRPSRRRRSSGGGWGKGLIAVAAAVALFFGVTALLPEKDPEPAPDTKLESPLPTQPPAATEAPMVTFPRMTEPVMPEPTIPEVAPQATENRYFRKKLDAEAQKVYDTFLYAIEQHLPKSGDVFISDLNTVSTVLEYLRWDYPEHFWYRGSTYYHLESNGGYEVSLEPKYLCTAAERAQRQQVLDAGIRPIITQLTGASDYDKVMGVYRYLIDLFAYDLDYTGTTLYEAFSDNRAVCEGYAKATQYILNELGVEALYVEGHTLDGSPDGHAWNIVKINGVYYQLDTTWGDPLMEDGSQIMTYGYCLLDDATMGRDHFPKYDASLYPACNAMDAHYYVKQGRYFYVYDRQLLTELFRTPIATQEEVSFRFADKKTYEQAKKELFDREVIWQIVKDLGWEGKLESYSSSLDDKTFIIGITFNHAKP